MKKVGAAGVSGATGLLFPVIASAEIEVPPQITEYEYPQNWGLTYNYEEDAAKVREHMVIATGL